MTIANMDMSIHRNPRTQYMDREALMAMVERLERSGTDTSFYVEALSKMDAFEQTLPPRVGPSAPAPSAAIKPRQP